MSICTLLAVATLASKKAPAPGLLNSSILCYLQVHRIWHWGIGGLSCSFRGLSKEAGSHSSQPRNAEDTFGLGSVSLSETQVLEHSIFGLLDRPVCTKLDQRGCVAHQHFLYPYPCLVVRSVGLVAKSQGKEEGFSPQRKGKNKDKGLALCAPLVF